MSTLFAIPMNEQDHHHHHAAQPPRRHKKMLRDGSGEVWPDHAELLFSRAIAEYDRQSALSSNSGSPYPPDLPSRNEFIVRYLKEKGLERSKQQVASHIQQLKKRSSKEGGMGAGGSGSSNGSSPIASPSTLSAVAGGPGAASWINPYTGMTSPAPSGTQPFYHQQQQQQYSIPSSPSYHRSPISPSATSHFVSSSSHSSPHSIPSSPPATGPITSLQIRIGNSQSISVPLAPSSSNSSITQGGGVTVQTLSSNSVKIRLLVPPHSSPLAHLQSANIYAVIGIRNDVFHRLTGRMVGNRIWVDGRPLGEETDMFDVKSSSSSSSPNSVSIVAPLRINAATLMGQHSNIGVLTVNQTIYGPPSSSSNHSSYPNASPSALMSINYELVHAAHPALPAQQQHAQHQLTANMNYGVMGGATNGYGNPLSHVWGSGANAGPFTQF